MEEIRLQKYLAEAGVASRRKCEEFIQKGRVKINGNVATLGEKVNPEIDKVEFDNKEGLMANAPSVERNMLKIPKVIE